MSDTATATRGETRELRLAVVLYGGVSLAIYMHGTTKELHRLVKASALAESDVEAEATPSEAFYRELLDELARRDKHGVRTRVVVDVVAGTSAGGINGVYLAKALAHNRSQDALRGLWLTKGDIKKLLRGTQLHPCDHQGAVSARAHGEKAAAARRRDRAMDVPALRDMDRRRLASCGARRR